MSRRRNVWAASTVPDLRRTLTRAMRETAAHYTRQAGQAATTGQHAYRHWFADSADDYRHLADRFDTAALFWVTDDMAKTALDASTDIPGIVEDDVPSSTGLMCFEKPLPPKSTAAFDGLAVRDKDGQVMSDVHRDPVPVDAIGWMRFGTDMRVELFTRTGNLPGPLLPVGSELQPFANVVLPVPTRFDDDTPVVTADGGTDTDHKGILAFVAATWIMMMVPTVAERRTLSTGTGGTKAGVSVERDVTLVDLRPLRHVKTDDVAAPAGRQYRSRWIVRGHWRQQAHGPKRAQRRATWIPSHIKGPEGAPLKATEHVHVWRR